MGEKDISEKELEHFNDVFADIANVCFFKGRKVVHENSLKDVKTRNFYQATNGKLREVERDVSKLWTDGKKKEINIALIGLENQTESDKLMPIRKLYYDGSSYRSQLVNNEDAKEPLYPVISIVLYFGMQHWKHPTNLKEVLEIPEELQEYVNDYKVHIVEVAWLTDEQINMFTSDFKVVADFFVQLRKNNSYEASKVKLEHIDAVLKFLRVFANVTEFDDFLAKNNNNENNEKERPTSVCEVLTRQIQAEVAKEVEKEVAKGNEKTRLEDIVKLVKKTSVEQAKELLDATDEEMEKALESMNQK